MSYVPKTPIRIPAGSRVTVTGTFDNSARNKFNPDPTKPVRYGEPTYDEMMMGFVDYIVEKPATIAKIDPQVFDTYAGKYRFAGDRTYTISRDGSRYFGQGTGGMKRELLPIGPGKFIILEVETTITFAANEKGEMTMTYKQGDNTLKFPKLTESAAGGGQQ